jgi:CHRD domain
MQKSSLAVLAAVGITAAIAIPTIAFGNARSNQGSLNSLQVAQTPFLARLAGANEVPTPNAGDPDGVGAAAVTFDIVDATNPTTGAQVCWDLSYSGIAPPNLAHIHRGAAGVAGPVVVDFGAPGATSHTGCQAILPALATEIMTTPANFYVNVHNGAFPNGAMRGQLAKGPLPAGEIHLLPAPLRAYDSRDNAGAKIAAGETRTISLATGKDSLGASQIALPPGATGALVTLTVTDTVGPGGFLKLYSAAIQEPSTSSINWAGVNQNVAVGTQVAVDATAQVKVTGGASPTNFVIDVIGYLF